MCHDFIFQKLVEMNIFSRLFLLSVLVACYAIEPLKNNICRTGTVGIEELTNDNLQEGGYVRYRLT